MYPLLGVSGFEVHGKRKLPGRALRKLVQFANNLGQAQISVEASRYTMNSPILPGCISTTGEREIEEVQMHLDFVRFVLFRVFPVLAFSTFLAPFVALSQNPEPETPPDFSECAQSFFQDISSKCGPYADPKDWYQPENECTIKAAEAFDLCKDAGYEARYIAIHCDPAAGHAVVGCKIEGKWVILDTASADPLRQALDTEAFLQNEFVKRDPPILPLMNGDTPTDQFACFLAGRDPRTDCGCKKDPEDKTNCQCKARVESSVPAGFPANTGFCSRVQEMDPTGFSVSECKKCCKDRHKLFQDMEKPMCDAFINECGQAFLEEPETYLPRPPGDPTVNLYLGLMALWRCDQWPKQTQAFLEKCQQACDANSGRLVTITLLPRSVPTVNGLGAIMTQLKGVPGAEGKCTIPNTCKLPLVKEKTLILTAKPKDSSVEFLGWKGLCQGKNKTCSFVVSKTGAVIADFGKRCALEGDNANSLTSKNCCNGLKKCENGICRKSCFRKLTVQIVGVPHEVPGTVSDFAGKIKCPKTCEAAEQPYGSRHMLMPTQYPGFEFVRWDGCTSVLEAECTAVLAPGDKIVKAIFKRACVPQCVGNCGGDSCGGTCGQCAPPQTCNGDGICEDPHTLSLNIVMGRGAQGSVSFDPARDACTTQCERQFPRDRNVTLTARATTTDGIFQGWGGDCGGSDNTCIVSMNAAKNVTAKFDKPCPRQCSGRNCGPDGCGRSCGSCASGQTCSWTGICMGSQTCRPNCVGKQCGPDGCGGTCNWCASDKTCSAAGQCVPGSVCTPNCGIRTCGSDGCGGWCGGQQSCGETAPTCSTEGGSCYTTNTVSAVCCDGLRCINGRCNLI